MNATTNNYRSNSASASEELICDICGDRGTGRHYGAISCDGCKGFFRRTIRKQRTYLCRFQSHCTIDKDYRNSCRSCRYQKCLTAGMKTDAVQHERDKVYVEPGTQPAPAPSQTQQYTQQQQPQHVSFQQQQTIDEINQLSMNAESSPISNQEMYHPSIDMIGDSFDLLLNVADESQTNNQYINQSNDQSINQYINKSNDQSINQYINKSNDQSINQSQTPSDHIKKERTLSQLEEALRHEQNGNCQQNQYQQQQQQQQQRNSHQKKNNCLEDLLRAELVAEQKLNELLTEDPNSREQSPVVQLLSDQARLANGFRVANLDDVNESMRRQLLVMIEWAKSLHLFKLLTVPDQVALLRNYSAQHMLICCAYRSHLMGLEDTIHLSNNTVLARDARSVHDINEVSRRTLDELLAPMRQLNVQRSEYVLMKAIIMFNPRVSNLTDRITVEQIRQRMIDSLETCLQGCVTGGSSCATRIANLLLILPSLQAIAQGFLEDLNMVTLFGLAQFDTLMEELLPISYQNSRNLPGNKADELEANPHAGCKRRMTVCTDTNTGV